MPSFTLLVLLLTICLTTVTNAMYYHNLPYSTKTIQSRLQARRYQDSSQISSSSAHFLVLRPDYALRSINKVADVFRNFLHKRLVKPTTSIKRSTITYDFL